MNDSTTDNDEDWTLFGFVFGLALFAVIIIYTGGITWLLWGWHAGPFTDIELTLAQTIGATTLLGAIRGYRAKKGKSEVSLSKMLSVYTLALLIGWIAHLFA